MSNTVLSRVTGSLADARPLDVGLRAARPRRRRWLRAVAAMAATVALGACGSFADMLTPGERGHAQPAMLSFRANIAMQQTASADVVTLDVSASYLRQDSSLVPIASQVLRLTSAELQPVPIPVDIGDCLTDPARDGARGSCAVLLNLALVVNGEVVDRQVIGPLRLTPGEPADVSTPVTLFQLAAVGLLDNAGTSLSDADTLQLAPGATQQLSARVTDASDAVVTDRTVSWSSDASEVVSVSATGQLTAVAEGVARITTSLGTLNASTMVRVVRPAVSLEVVARAGSGNGRVQSTPAGIDCVVSAAGTAGACAFSFPASTEVTLQSTANDGNLFSAWGDACATSDAAASCTVQLEDAQVVSAQFTALRQLVIVAGNGSDGSGRIVGPNGLDCIISGGAVSGSCAVTLPEGTDAALTASASGELDQFAGWGSACSGTGATTDGATCTVPLNGDNATVSAGFHGARALAVTIDGAGDAGGAVQIAGALSCVRGGGVLDGTCETSFAHNTVVTLTALPDAQSEFVEWSGACTGRDARCDVTMSQARAVTATMRERLLTLNVAVAGAGAGSVSLNGVEMCTAALGAPDAACQRTMRIGDTITLSATAAEFSSFDGFSSNPADRCIGTDSCTFVADAPVSVRAEFSQVPASITMITSPLGSTGSGLVVSNTTDGIQCDYSMGVLDGRCSTPADLFAPVQLTATPGTSSVLLAWGGACANAKTTTCTVAPEGDEMVSAQFSAAINVDIEIPQTNGAGVVRFNVPYVPSQPSCSASAGGDRTCGYALPVGTTGIFSAEAAPGSTFVGFSGPCLEGTGPVPTCTYRGFGFVRVIEAVFTTP